MEKETNLDEDALEVEGIATGNLMESRVSQLDDVLNAKLSRAFHANTAQVLFHEIAKIASEHDPIDLAYAVTRLPPHARIVVYENLPDITSKVTFIVNTGSNTRTAIFRQIDDQQIKQLIDLMPPDEAVWVLDDLPDRRLKRILDLLEIRKANRIKDLQQHDRHSAGRLMTNEFFAFHMNTTIGEVAASIRENPGIDLTRRIFVLNDLDELIGYVPGRNLIVNPHYLPIRQVMRPVVQKVNPDTSRDEVVDLVERYKIPALPVVDDHEKLVGIVTYEDVVEAMGEIAADTIANIGGTAEVVSEHDPIIKRFLWRAPWLLVTLGSGLLNTASMAFFSTALWAFVPFFVPLITGMSGNVGLQCSTVLVRSMSTGELSSGARAEAISKELGIGLIIGIAFGIGCGILVYLLDTLGVYSFGVSSWILGITICCGLFGACLTATTLGTFSPFLFASLRIDPAVASGPIVTAFNDLFSTLMFLLIAKTMSTLLLSWGV